MQTNLNKIVSILVYLYWKNPDEVEAACKVIDPAGTVLDAIRERSANGSLR